MDAISTAYSDMRSKQSSRNLPVTARSLETIIRLSSAHAKSRLSNVVEESDVEEVLDILNFVLFHEIGKDHESSDSRVAMKGVKRNIKEGGEEGGETSNDEDDLDEDGGSILLKRARSAVREEDEDEDEDIDVDRESSRYQRVLEVVHKLGDNEEASVGVEVILNRLNSTSEGSKNYSSRELKTILTEMERENKVMFDDGEVYIL